MSSKELVDMRVEVINWIVMIVAYDTMLLELAKLKNYP